MKKSVMLSVLGLGLATAATTAYGQGAIVISNYQTVSNPVVWNASNLSQAGLSDADGRVSSTDGVNLTLFWGPGTVSDPTLLTQSTALSWNSGGEGNGYFGYYGPNQANISGWTAGSTWSFQVRATGSSIKGSGKAVDTVNSRSVIWQEQANIHDVSGTPAGSPGISTQSIGFTVLAVVPEPSTFALAGLGAAALMVFRRRK